MAEGTMTPADISAVVNRDRDGYNDGMFGGEWFWIIILLFFFCGNGFGYGRENNWENEFLKRDIFSTNQNVSNTACQTQRDVLENRYALGSQIQENKFSCSQNACATQKEILQNRYDNALQAQTLSSQMASCCCDLKTAIHAEGEATRNMIQADKIEQLRDQVFASNLALNNANLANTVINAVRPTPTPAYLTCSPYFAYNAGCGSSTGCGCNLI